MTAGSPASASNLTWTTSWTFGDESGVIDGIVATGSIEDSPVGQIQAVVVG